MKRCALLLISLIVITSAATASAAPADRTINDRFQISVDWIHDPAILGDTNGVQLTIRENGEPVTGKSADLAVQVTYMDAVRVLNLQESEPGVYTGVFIPMQAGDYNFQITGTIDGVAIDEVVTTEDGLSKVYNRIDFEFPMAAHGFDPVSLAMPVGAVMLMGIALWWYRRPVR